MRLRTGDAPRRRPKKHTQAPEPTSASVIIRAFARFAAAWPVAHL